jgi:capsid protein
VRGVPIFTSSLDLFGELRAFRKAVIANAQTAASLTGVVEQDLSPADDEDEDSEFKPFKRVPVERNMLTFLPAKTKLTAFDPKQPQTTYEMFQQVCLGEAIRPLAYPLNLALGTSQKFNFSSAKLDHINYRASLTIERNECGRVVLNKLFAAWFEEAVLRGAIRMWDGLRIPPHEWHWPGYESIDPQADVDADAAAIAAGLLTLREYWARRGKDWRLVLRQQKAEADELSKMGLAFGDVVKRAITETDADPAETEHANAA